MLSAMQQMMEAEIRELISVLGATPQESSAVLMQVLEGMVKPGAAMFDPEDLVTKLTSAQVSERIQGAGRNDLESWFLYFFPRGTPKLLAEQDLRAYTLTAVKFQKKTRGGCPE